MQNFNVIEDYLIFNQSIYKLMMEIRKLKSCILDEVPINFLSLIFFHEYSI